MFKNTYLAVICIKKLNVIANRLTYVCIKLFKIFYILVILIIVKKCDIHLTRFILLSQKFWKWILMLQNTILLVQGKVIKCNKNSLSFSSVFRWMPYSKQSLSCKVFLIILHSYNNIIQYIIFRWLTDTTNGPCPLIFFFYLLNPRQEKGGVKHVTVRLRVIVVDYNQLQKLCNRTLIISFGFEIIAK